MHPVHYLFEDIYRNHWGIPKQDKDARKKVPARPRLQLLRRLPRLP